MRIGIAALALGAVLVASTATAQTPSTTKPTTAKNGRELTVGGIFAGPTSMGSADAQLFGPNNTPSLTLFSTKNTMSAGFGPEVLLGFKSGRRLWFEVGAGVTWPSLKTTVTKDFEQATDQVLSARVTSWSVEGALLWYFHQGPKTSWFIRGSGGLMGEVSSDLSVSKTGFIGSGGLGVRHWWRADGKGAIKRVGLRAEFRGVVRTGGISLDNRTARFGPAGTVHLVFGY